MSNRQTGSGALTLTCVLAAVAVVFGVGAARCTADRQWDPNRRMPEPQPTAVVSITVK